MPESFDDMLAHFGVRGMRWGVRKSRSGKSSSGEKKKGGDSDAPKKEASDKKSAEPPAAGGKKTSNKKRKAGDLTDAQLREAVNRLQMEKQYRELTKSPPGKLAAGKAFAAAAIAQVAKQQLAAIANSHATKLTGGLMAGPAPAKTIAKAQDTLTKAKAKAAPTARSKTFLPPPASTRVG